MYESMTHKNDMAGALCYRGQERSGEESNNLVRHSTIG